MPEPRPEDRRAAANAGFLGRVSGLLGALAGYSKARLQLAGLEAKEALLHFIIIGALLAGGLVIVVFGYFFAVFAFIFFLAWLIPGEATWIWLTLGAAIVHFGLALALILVARAKFSTPMFTATLDEFRKDQQWLNTTNRKAELIAELDRARSRASANRREIERGKAKTPYKAEATVSRHRYAWIIGAIVAGFIVAKLPARTKKVYVNRKGEPTEPAGLQNVGRAGLAMAILKIVIDITKPVLMAWATKRLGEAVSVGKDVRRKVEKVDRKI